MRKVRRASGIAALVVLALTGSAYPDRPAEPPEMTVYATPTCGCCGAWIEHLREHGFRVEVVYQDDLSGVRSRHRVPPELLSCHMGVVEGFAVEGHVPAEVVQQMLIERPAILGIAVPGMPAGSPGMERPDGLVQPYAVYGFDESGPTAVYAVRR